VQSESGSRDNVLQKAFDAAYGMFNKSLAKESHVFLKEFQSGMQHFHATQTSYTYYPDKPHCDKGVYAPLGRHVDGLSAFPGGQSDIFGALASAVHSEGSVGGVSQSVMASQDLASAKGLVQSLIATVVHVVPPLIPPPAWNSQPLPCLPMVTGHNCFGSVLYPITAADFVLADVTDSMMDGLLSGFPATYAQKVGKTTDAMYKGCAAAYFSMHCSSLFPRCQAPQSREEAVPAVGRAPMCLHLCVLPLVMCPGFWVNDIAGPCSMVSVPPACTQAFFVATSKVPPQYVSMDEANPYPKDCPAHDAELDGVDDPTLYEAGTAPFGAGRRALRG